LFFNIPGAEPAPQAPGVEHNRHPLKPEEAM
jgi:hypothetical protein